MVGLIFILLFNIQDTVTATTYRLTAKENGPYGNNMASGYKVSYKHPGRDRVVAVSRDLLKKYPFHTVIVVQGAGKLDGKWIVEDVMSKRWHKRIDFLIDWKVKTNKFHKVIIKKYDNTKTITRHRISRTNNVRPVRTKHRYHKTKSTNHRNKSSKRFTSKS
jgi:3D (Asp-Asp-Asp) domain-containing protein